MYIQTHSVHYYTGNTEIKRKVVAACKWEIVFISSVFFLPPLWSYIISSDSPFSPPAPLWEGGFTADPSAGAGTVLPKQFEFLFLSAPCSPSLHPSLHDDSSWRWSWVLSDGSCPLWLQQSLISERWHRRKTRTRAPGEPGELLTSPPREEKNNARVHILSVSQQQKCKPQERFLF